MGLCYSGVSGGLAVGPTPTSPLLSPQTAGVSLSAAGDYAVIFIDNGAPPGGPDVAGIFALSGTFTGASVALEFVADMANWSSGNWQNLNSALRRDTNAFVNGPFVIPNSQALQLDPGNVQSLFAVRVKLTAITTGAVLVSGNTNPGSVAGLDAAILAQMLALGTLLKANVLALSDQTSTDYLGVFGGTY
jgi:hypothetical protein